MKRPAEERRFPDCLRRCGQGVVQEEVGRDGK